MQPYQRANDEQIRQRDEPINALKQVGNVAAGLGTAYAGGAIGSSLAQKVLPMLSKYIPEDLAIKGLNKIDPRLGKFVQKAMENGESFDDAKEFIEEKAAPAAAQKKEGNIIKQYSPELHQFIDQEIKNGESPIAAASKASRSKKFEKEINKLVHDHKLDWTSIVESVFGNGGKAQAGAEQSQAALQSQGQQQQAGPGQQALMQTLQKINQRLGG